MLKIVISPQILIYAFEPERKQQPVEGFKISQYCRLFFSLLKFELSNIKQSLINVSKTPIKTKEGHQTEAIRKEIINN